MSSDIEYISSGSEDGAKTDAKSKDVLYQEDCFNQMIKLCLKSKKCPQKYIDDMNEMYSKCSDKQKTSQNLCKLIIKGVENISPKNKSSFNYAANVYNKLLEVTNTHSASSLDGNCLASTSNGSKNEKDNSEICESRTLFNEIISKCYANPNFPPSNIKMIDQLFKSLPLEFVDTKSFTSFLREVNQIIWPDSGKMLYVHIEHIYEQLMQFKTSMEVQDISAENSEINAKRLKKIDKLLKAQKRIDKKIRHLDEAEMDINDDSEFGIDSAYIMKDRYEKRAIEIHRLICKLRNEPNYIEKPMLRFDKTNNKLVNKTIERYYNTNKIFPDYFEIYTLMKLLNEKKKLNWTATELQNISQDAFLKLGFQLKQERLQSYFGLMANDSSAKDPAEDNPELRKKLEESNQKLDADLKALEKKFHNKQEYAEETEGSSINNTDCEKSSEDEEEKEYFSNKRKIKHNNKSINTIEVKRKRILISESENEEPPKKNKKSVYMEKIDLEPYSSDTSNKSIQQKDKEINIDDEKSPEKIITTENTNGDMNKKISSDTEEVTDKISQVENINDNNSFNNIKFNVVENTCNRDSIGDGNLEIDKDANVDINFDETIPLHPNDEENDHQNGLLNSSAITIDDNSSEPIITEPEEQVHEGEQLGKEVIETDENNSSEPIITEPEVVIHEGDKNIIEIDENDSDVEITSCDPIKAPQKKSIEAIIKSLNFEKKYSWDQHQPTQRQNSSNSSQSFGLRTTGDPSLNLNTFVNRWVVPSHNIRPPPTKSNNRNIGYPNIRLPVPNQRAQSTFHRSSTQTQRQVTTNYFNQQSRRQFMTNQSVVRQQITTMTTTTTVRRLLQQRSLGSSRRITNSTVNNFSASSRSNRGDEPELIELE